jgi:hypothetical protein
VQREEPADYDDIAAWDRYHGHTMMAERIASARRALRYVPDLEASRFERLWFAGCGTSLAPRSFAELGFEVVATDLSREALDMQWQSQRSVSAELLHILYEQAVSGLAPERGGKLEIVKHDLRVTMPKAPFDAVLNIKAWTGFSAEDRAAIARSHVDALRAGGWAIFETAGVLFEARDALEDLLLEAGASMPLNDCVRWYRRALAETGLPIAFVLGHPRVDTSAGYLEQPGEQDTLASIEQEYLQRRRAARERQGPPPKDARLAFVLYD